VAIQQAQAFCNHCQKKTLHQRDGGGAPMGCLALVLLGGILLAVAGLAVSAILVVPVLALLVLAVWYVRSLKRSSDKPWNCQGCGRERLL
jgi:hypothetical protein